MFSKLKKRLPPNRLSEQAIAGFAAPSKPEKHADGAGLFLEVNPKGSRYWRFRYRFDGMRNTLSCGTWPAVSLDMARARRDELLALVAAGIDPSTTAKAERAQRVREQAERNAAKRFYLDNDGALSVRIGHRHVLLTPSETAELRAFLDATKALPCKVTPCP